MIIEEKHFKIIYLDLDRTLWWTHCSEFDEIWAKDMDRDSLELDYDKIIDIHGNTCRPIYYSTALINILKRQSDILKVYSLGLEDDLKDYKLSAAYRMLELLDIVHEFNEIIIDKYKPKLPKSVKILAQLDTLKINPSDCLLIDDNPYQLYMAKKQGINILDSKSDEFGKNFS